VHRNGAGALRSWAYQGERRLVYPLGEVSLDSGPVVHVHEFGWDQPDGKPAIGQPCIGQEEEVGIEARQAADPEAEPLRGDESQSRLALEREMVVSDVRGVREDQVGLLIGFEAGEIGLDHLQRGGLPEGLRGSCEIGVDLHAAGIADDVRGEDLP
jgi:hypothetical protein